MLAEHASLTRKAFKLKSTAKVASGWSKRSAVNKNALISPRSRPRSRTVCQLGLHGRESCAKSQRPYVIGLG
jgi:hypothetical protein